MVLTGYMAGATGGTLIGGWFVDRAKGSGLMGSVTILTLFAMAMFLVLGLCRQCRKLPCQGLGCWLALPWGHRAPRAMSC
jgi:MFS family permease